MRLCSLSSSLSGPEGDNYATDSCQDQSGLAPTGTQTHGLVSSDCEPYYQGNSSVLQGHLRGFSIWRFVQLHKLLFLQHTQNTHREHSVWTCCLSHSRGHWMEAGGIIWPWWCCVAWPEVDLSHHLCKYFELNKSTEYLIPMMVFCKSIIQSINHKVKLQLRNVL